MKISFLQSDAASMIALTIIERHGGGESLEGRDRLYRQLVQIILAGIESYEGQVERMHRRLFTEGRN